MYKYIDYDTISIDINFFNNKDDEDRLNFHWYNILITREDLLKERSSDNDINIHYKQKMSYPELMQIFSELDNDISLLTFPNFKGDVYVQMWSNQYNTLNQQSRAFLEDVVFKIEEASVIDIKIHRLISVSLTDIDRNFSTNNKYIVGSLYKNRYKDKKIWYFNHCLTGPSIVELSSNCNSDTKILFGRDFGINNILYNVTEVEEETKKVTLYTEKECCSSKYFMNVNIRGFLRKIKFSKILNNKI